MVAEERVQLSHPDTEPTVSVPESVGICCYIALLHIFQMVQGRREYQADVLQRTKGTNKKRRYSHDKCSKEYWFLFCKFPSFPS